MPLCRQAWFLIRLQARHRLVSTWSPLGSAFNELPKTSLNFRFRNKIGLFGIPQLVHDSGFHLLQENVQNETDKLIKEATSPARNRKIVEIFDELSDCICRVADMADFIRVAHPQKPYTQMAEETCIALTSLVEKLNTNIEIHKALKHVLENDDIIPMDSVERRVAELFMFDFEQSGIHLDEKKRQKFVELNESIMMLSNFFMQGTQNNVAIPKDSLPEEIRQCFSVAGDTIAVTGLFSDHYSDKIREAAYRTYLHPNSHQEELLSNLLKARRALAKLVGFPNFTSRGLKGTLGETPENVMNFLISLADNVKESAEKDYDDMLKRKIKDGGQNVLMPWDPPYYTSIGRQELCKLDPVDLAPYFSIGSCMEGLNNLFKALFDVTLDIVEREYGELWHDRVYKLAVTHGTEGVLGYIYCDFYERSGKLNQDCHFTIQGGRRKSDGTYQLPMVVLQLNLPSFYPRSPPPLLTPGMMENLFHEFGHAMHSMLGRTRFQHVTGTRCPVDFAEVPSVLMEYFASDPRVIASFARHYNTAAPLSEEAINNMCQSKRLYMASDLQVQVFYAILDQIYHGDEIPNKSTTEIMAEVQSKYYSLPYVPNTAWQLRFGHLVGYGGKYYSYLMSRAIACKLWKDFFRDDPFNRENGEKYRQKMLAHGGEKSPRELITDMFGEEPTVEMLVNSLTEDLHSRRT